MCGVVALHRYQSGPALRESHLLAIRDAMITRGPDDAGNWISADGDVAFGHRRLSIIGLGDQGAQPMVLATRCLGGEGPIVVSFNGEIYNHENLRAQLRDQGHTFHSECDTEVLLHLYEEYGHNMTGHIRGMFAFALWDGRNRQLLLVRDPYGIKPLYFRDDGATLSVASQVRSLMAGGLTPQTSDAALAGFLLFGSIPEPLTFSSQVQALPAGSYLIVKAGRVMGPTPYFELSGAFRADPSRPEEGTPSDGDQVRQAVVDSVAAHLVADVEVGVFLSAGIDSAAVLGLSAEMCGQMTAVTLAFEEYAGTADDEESVAREIAHRYGAKHHVERISLDEFHRSCASVLGAMDQPTIDGVNTWLVSRAAHNLGLKVALSGLGGDELFGGYNSFESVPRWAARLKWPARVPGLGSAVTAALRRLLPDRISPKAASVLEYGGSLEETWFVRRALFMPWELPAVLGEDRAVAALAALDLRERLRSPLRPEPDTDFGKVAALEGGLYMRNQLLRDTDWASMAHSLEVRVPLVDHMLLKSIASTVSRSWKHKNGKLPLAMTVRPRLPESVTLRRKTGFSVPIGSWLGKMDDYQSWRRVPMLDQPHCPWSRRWAYTVADYFGMLDS